MWGGGAGAGAEEQKEGKEGGASEVWLRKPTQGNGDFTGFPIATESSRLIIFVYNL